MKISQLILIFTFFTFSFAYGQPKNIPNTWKLGTSSMLLDDFTVKTLREARKSGISSIEILWNSFLKKTPEERSDAADMILKNAKKAKLEIWSAHLPYGAAYDISTADESKRVAIVNAVKGYIDLSAKLHVKQMVIHASGDKVADGEREERIIAARTSLKELSNYANEKKLGLNVECLPRKCLGNTGLELLRILDGMPELGICFDTNHSLKETPEEFVNVVGPRIKMVHISDYDNIDEKHWMPGRGINNWNKIISALMNNRFNGRFMYEVSRKKGDTFSVTDLKANFDELIRNWRNR